jgi:hypothetical protein
MIRRGNVHSKFAIEYSRLGSRKNEHSNMEETEEISEQI